MAFAQPVTVLFRNARGTETKHLCRCSKRSANSRAASIARPRMGLMDVFKSVAKGPSSQEKIKSGLQAISSGQGLDRFAERVTKINAMEDELEGLDNDTLLQKIGSIRDMLHENSTDKDRHLEEVFAIVREASFRVLGLRHYDVQLIGGMILDDGCVAEMATGEGKTLVAALPAVLNALTGEQVFIVTVNDYLAKRDAELIGQIYRFLGLSVGLVQSSSTPEQRSQAYSCDITYVTNSELGFDYLRDNLAFSMDDMVISRPFGFCIVDEADSILIDEARTPLIISGKTSAPKDKYATAAKLASQLEKELHYKANEKEQSVVLTDLGFVVVEEALGVGTLFDVQDPWASYITNALKAKELFRKDINYIVRESESDIQIVDEFTGRVLVGRRWSDGLHQAVEAKEGLEVDSETTVIASVSYQAFFKLFPRLSGMTGTASTEANEFQNIYDLQVLSVPTALPCARKDYEDVVFRTEEAKYRAIMAEIARVAPTGRPILIGTTSIETSEALSNLLKEVNIQHDLLNARPESAARESEIVAQAGREFSLTIATNMAGRGTDILLGGNADYFARACARREFVLCGNRQGIDLGAISTSLKLIDDYELPCDVSQQALDDLKSAVEALIVSRKPQTLLDIDQLIATAAEFGPIGEDANGELVRLRKALHSIRDDLAEAVAEEREDVIKAGGLYVVGTERAESRRVDNQLRGRTGRQGDPGGSRFFLSLDDRLFRVFGGDKVRGILDAFRVDENMPIENKSVTSALDNAQKNVEEYYADIRQQLYVYDNVLSSQRAAFYSKRRQVLMSDSQAMWEQLSGECKETAREIVEAFTGRDDGSEDDLEALSQKLSQFFPDIGGVKADELSVGTNETKSLLDKVFSAVDAVLAAKADGLEQRRSGLSQDIARYLELTQMDNSWQAHMKRMDYLKEFVGLRSYGQENPLDAYQVEGFEIFKSMLSEVRRNTVYSFFQYRPK